jgi:ABC-type Zn uptake system ZnuABC Zn-binding protein ZnuA
VGLHFFIDNDDNPVFFYANKSEIVSYLMNTILVTEFIFFMFYVTNMLGGEYMRSMYKVLAFFGIILVLFWWINVPILNSQKHKPYTVVVSTPLLKDLVGQLLGPDVQVISIVPSHVSPESYVPSNQDIIQISAADMVIMYSLDLSTISLDSVVSQNTKRIDLDPLLNRIFQGQSGNARYYWANLEAWQTIAFFLTEMFKVEFPEKQSEIKYRSEGYVNQILDLQKFVFRKTQQLDLEKHRCITNDPALLTLIEFMQLQCQFISLTNDMPDAEFINILKEFSGRHSNVLFSSPFYDQEAVNKLGDIALTQGIVTTIFPHVYIMNVGEGAESDTYYNIITKVVNSLVEAL